MITVPVFKLNVSYKVILIDARKGQLFDVNEHKKRIKNIESTEKLQKNSY